MVEVKVTLCLRGDLREFDHDDASGNAVRKAVYDILNGSFCWAVMEYKTATGMGCESLHFKLEGLGLPSMLNHSFDREPPPGIAFEPNGFGALVPVKITSNLEPALSSVSPQRNPGAPDGM